MCILDLTNAQANQEPMFNFVTEEAASLVDVTVDGKMKEHKGKTILTSFNAFL